MISAYSESTQIHPGTQQYKGTPPNPVQYNIWFGLELRPLKFSNQQMSLTTLMPAHSYLKTICRENMFSNVDEMTL